MKLLIVTDAWAPQVNGVVTTLRTIGDHLTRAGRTVRFLSPNGFQSIPCPTYPEIRLSLLPYRGVCEEIERFAPDALHLATEGPLGLSARRYCASRGLRFTTAYHTRFPEYVHARTRIPVGITYRWLHHFHDRAHAMLVPTPAIRRELLARGFRNTVAWSHGVDLATFTPGDRDRLDDSPRPVFLYVGRVAVEKNIEAFLRLDLPGTKWVVGEGPMRPQLQRRYPEVRFAGIQTTTELARIYRAADVFVFPSLTDTFGLVMLEAMAAGLPVAAFPAPGPIDIIPKSNAGVLAKTQDSGLREACLACLELDHAAVRRFAEGFSWRSCAEQFLKNLEPYPEPEKTRFWRKLRRLARLGRKAEAMAAWDELRRCRPAAFALVAGEYADAALACGRVASARDALIDATRSDPGIDVLRALARLDPADPAMARQRLLGMLRQQPTLSAALDLLADRSAPLDADALQALQQAVAAAAKPLQRYRCAACGFEAQHWFWQCPGCLGWDSYPPRRIEEQ